MKNTNDQTAHDIGQGNDDSRNRITPYELRGTIHRSVEVGLPGNFLASSSGLGLVNETRVQVRINCHLTSRHGIQNKTSTHFTDPRRAFRDDQELNDNQNSENDQPDDNAVTSDKIPETCDHTTSSVGAVRFSTR